MKYQQLTLEKRYHISAFKKQGYKQFEIANELGVHPSTISRELAAQSESSLREKKKAKRSSITQLIGKYIRSKLKKDWSPEQISGRIKLDIHQTVHHETIYQNG